MEIGGRWLWFTYISNETKAEEYETRKGITILDGSPGIGCSVIASITANDWVLMLQNLLNQV